MRRMGFNMVDHGAWLGSIRHPPKSFAWQNEVEEPANQPFTKTNVAISTLLSQGQDATEHQ